ncbi:MAG TPA: hypothetical protein VG758_15950 [Hyphomicrobiaceae bacterium]|jgi:hypothetical protein|nr:hypothetical protein [Hyphomicrobiaceae bacterium]
MPASWTKSVLWSLFLVATTGAAFGAQQATPEAGSADRLTDRWCGPDQLSGQYECVTSVPMTEDEVRINLAYQTALGSLVGRRAASVGSTAARVAVRVSAP